MTDYEIQVIHLEPTHAVVLSRTVKRTGLGDAIGAAIVRARSLVTGARVSPIGPPFVRYLEWGDDVEMEVGFPLGQPQAIPSFRSTLLPGGTAATTWHRGSYSGLEAAFGALSEWVEANGRSAGAPWEYYWEAQDEDQPRTQVVWPVTLS